MICGELSPLSRSSVVHNYFYVLQWGPSKSTQEDPKITMDEPYPTHDREGVELSQVTTSALKRKLKDVATEIKSLEERLKLERDYEPITRLREDVTIRHEEIERLRVVLLEAFETDVSSLPVYRLVVIECVKKRLTFLRRRRAAISRALRLRAPARPAFAENWVLRVSTLGGAAAAFIKLWVETINSIITLFTPDRSERSSCSPVLVRQ